MDDPQQRRQLVNRDARRRFPNYDSIWPLVPLSRVASIERQSVSPREVQGQERYVGLEHIGRDGSFHDVTWARDADIRSNKFTFSQQHLLYGKLRPNLGKIAAPDFDGICSTDILPLKTHEGVERRYLMHFLRTPMMVRYAAARAVGINLPRLSPQTLSSFLIPLPPIDEQQRIAAVLDAAEMLRKKRHEALAKQDELTQALFIDMFGDPISNPCGWREGRVLGDVAEIRSGITKGRKITDVPLAPVPYLAVVNVQDGYITLDPLKSLDATATEVEKYRLQAGDIVLTEGGDADKLGRGAVWRGQIDPCIHQNHVFRVRLTDPGMTPEFVSRLLGSQRGKRYFLRMAKQTTGIASINLTQLRGFPLLEPPRAAQEEFLDQLSSIHQAEVLLQRSAEQIDTLFASLQQRAFRGEL